MDFKQLEAFSAVVSLGSFSRAGERLFLTQPTISAHIRSLERELGVQLVVRTTKEVYPSEEGKRLYAYAQKLLRLRDDAIAAVTSSAPPVGGIVTVAASSIPAQYVLPGAAAAFGRTHPDAAVRSLRCDSAAVVRQVAEGTADLGMTGTAIPSPRCVFHDLCGDELVVVTPNTERYQALPREGFPRSLLLREKFIQREAGSGTRREFERFLEEIGVSPERLKVAAEMDDPEAIKRAVSQGLGISILSRRAAADFERFGLLLAFPLEGGALGRRLYLVQRRDGRLSPAARALAEFLLGQFRDAEGGKPYGCLLYTSPSPRDA